MRICLVTSYNEKYKKIAKITLPNITKYCDKHGLDFYKTEIDFTGGYKKWVWNKLLFIPKILPLYDWIICVDIDCLFINTNIQISQFIDNNYRIVIGENYHPDDWFTEFKTNLEFGVVFVKNEQQSYQILSEVYNDPNDSNHPWEEQYCLMKLLERTPEFNEAIKRIDMNLINTIPRNFVSPENTLIYHCAGGDSLPVEEKEKMLINMLKQSYDS